MGKKRRKSPFSDNGYEELIEIILDKKRDRDLQNCAYNEIQDRMKARTTFVVKQFYIPGLTSEDILQEALFALRFKAIPDYTITIGKNGEVYPFEKFAILCIRRHLSTLLKSSFQNKKKTLNTSFSLDQDVGVYEGDDIFLLDILPTTENNIENNFSNKEYYQLVIDNLMKKLSFMEKQVFVLYANRYSYEEICIIINRYYKRKEIDKEINTKSIDNALSRIKQKAQSFKIEKID